MLILGGTGEGRALGDAITDDPRFKAIYSVAGRTKAPLLPDHESRVGGFGGVDGLASYLMANSIDILVDATHPFATIMSANASQAAEMTHVPLIAITRPGWAAGPDDRWSEAATLEAAAKAIGVAPARVFLTIGKNDLTAFRAMPQHHYVIRSVDPPDVKDLPPDHVVIAARGPFSVADDVALLKRHRIDVIVSRNSGGRATESKLIAARALGVPIIMVVRPPLVRVAARFTTVSEALDWLRAHHGASLPTERGV